jgi:hypothetical protein
VDATTCFNVLAYGLGVAGAAVLLARRRWPVAVLGATLVVSAAYNLVGYPAGPTNVTVLVAVYSTAAAGRLMLALLAGGAFTGVGIAYRSLIEGDALGIEALSAAALLPTLALLGDAAYRRRATAGQAEVVDSREPPGVEPMVEVLAEAACPHTDPDPEGASPAVGRRLAATTSASAPRPDPGRDLRLRDRPGPHQRGLASATQGILNPQATPYAGPSPAGAVGEKDRGCKPHGSRSGWSCCWWWSTPPSRAARSR